MPGHDIIVLGASAGGVTALTSLVGALPRDLPAAIFIVLHVPAHSPSVLPNVLNRVSPFEVFHAVDRAAIQHGRVYIAVPDHHLLIEQGYIRVIRGPKENRHRPAIDPLFRSAAHVYGPRVAGVVLTGSLDDGTAGLQAIKTCGGIAIAQAPGDALYPSMPQSAIDNVEVDYVSPLAEIAPLLVDLAHRPVDGAIDRRPGCVDRPRSAKRALPSARRPPATGAGCQQPIDQCAYLCTAERTHRGTPRARD